MIGCNDLSELGRAEYVTLRVSSLSCSCNLSSLANFTFGSLGKCVNKLCFHFGVWLVEDMDEVVLENVCSHCQKMLEICAIDLSTPESSLVHLVSNP